MADRIPFYLHATTIAVAGRGQSNSNNIQISNANDYDVWNIYVRAFGADSEVVPGEAQWSEEITITIQNATTSDYFFNQAIPMHALNNINATMLRKMMRIPAGTNLLVTANWNTTTNTGANITAPINIHVVLHGEKVQA